MGSAEAHQSRELLVAFGLGQLDGPVAQTLAEHLETCADCREIAIQAPPDDFLTRVREVGGIEFADDAICSDLTEQKDYEILREIGRGGMGVVYLVRNRCMDRLEALKVVQRSLIARGTGLDRFQTEIRAAARLNHPHIVTAYSAPNWGGSLALAMEYVPGEDLHQVVQLKGALSVADACLCAYQAALGLQHAHERKMVHRDIKPSNLMLSAEGARPMVKVLDFGLAKAASESPEFEELTKQGQLLGSLHYVAPEQASDAASADIRSDIYSLGCTLYYLLAGRPPFQAKGAFELLKAHERMSPEPLDVVRPDVPAALAAVVSRMMAKTPAERYQTPVEAANALAPYIKSDESEPANQTIAQGAANRSHGLTRLAKWLGPMLAAPMLWAVFVLTVRTPDGVVEIEVNVDRPQVSIDGKLTTVNWENGGKRAEIRLTPGAHEIELRKEGLKAYGKRVVLEERGQRVIVARLKPLIPDIAAELSKKPAFARGIWKIVGDAVQQESKTPSVLLFGSPEFGDIDFTCELWHGVEDVGICVVFRATDLRNYYYFDIGGYKNSLFDLQAVDRGYRRLSVRRGSAATDRWSRVRVKMRGDSIEGYVDDQLMVHGWDDRRLKGYVGLRSWAGPARFRNLKVTDPNGNVLWDELPDLHGLEPCLGCDPDQPQL